MIEDISLADPTQQCGYYRGWDIACSGAIDRVWHSRAGFGTERVHRLLPFAEPSLVLRRRFEPSGKTCAFELVISPAAFDGDSYAPKPGEEQFAVRLAPEAIEGFLDLKASDYAAEPRAVPAGLLRKLDPVLVLAGRDRFARAWEKMAHILAGFERSTAESPLEYAAQRLRTASGRLAPAELAELAGISPRHLRRGFHDRFGRSPRAMARRLRLSGALIEAEGTPRPDWAGIAAGHRFSDQAHLWRECRAILGETPSALHAVRRAMAVSFKS